MPVQAHDWQDRSSFALADVDVHVWRAYVGDPEAEAAFSETLSMDEQQRASRLHFARDKTRFVVAHGILRRLLAAYVEADPRKIEFVCGVHRKPALKPDATRADLHFNLAHSGDLALFAFSRSFELGVDLERIAPERATLDIAERFFAPQELRALRALQGAERVAGFFQCWTSKEAFIKAVGKGLSMPLDSFVVSVAPHSPMAVLSIDGNRAHAAEWTLRRLTPHEEYAAALAVPSKYFQLSCYQFERGL